MVYIKVSHETAPDEIIGLTRSNTFTTCARCGREMSMLRTFLTFKEDPNFFEQQYICVKCCGDEYRMQQLAKTTSFFDDLLPDEEYQEGDTDEQ